MLTTTETAYFSVSTAASLMDSSVARVEQQISKGLIKPVARSGEICISERDMYRLGALLHLRDVENLPAAELDRVLERFVLPWWSR
jgi:hypothetical protein